MKIPKLKNKGFSIPLGIYPFTIFISFGSLDNFKKLFIKDEYMNKITEEGYNDIIFHFNNEDDYTAKTLQLNNGNILIHFKHLHFPNSNGYIVNTIAHESLHAVEMVLNRIGMKLNSKTDEAYCYLLGWIVEKIMEEI